MPTSHVAAFDVHYLSSGVAHGAAVHASDNHGADLFHSCTVQVFDIAPYEPGAFYLRELPVLLELLKQGSTEIIIIDGYVDLDPQGSPGLGARLHDAVSLPVIGIAKTHFHTATHAVPVLRGTSSNPLYVTARGISVQHAATYVHELNGKYRVPEIMRLADQLARGTAVHNPHDAPDPNA